MTEDQLKSLEILRDRLTKAAFELGNFIEPHGARDLIKHYGKMSAARMAEANALTAALEILKNGT